MLAVWTNLMVMIIIILTLSIPVGCFVKVVMFSSALTILLYVGVGVGSWMSDFFKTIYFDWVLNLWVQWQSHGAPPSTKHDICLKLPHDQAFGGTILCNKKSTRYKKQVLVIITKIALCFKHKKNGQFALLCRKIPQPTRFLQSSQI